MIGSVDVHNIIVMAIAELMHHIQVAPIINGSRNVK
jgi:hypothetical protein